MSGQCVLIGLIGLGGLRCLNGMSEQCVLIGPSGLGGLRFLNGMSGQCGLIGIEWTGCSVWSDWPELS